jgi:hypothetical protein
VLLTGVDDLLVAHVAAARASAGPRDDTTGAHALLFHHALHVERPSVACVAIDDDGHSDGGNDAPGHVQDLRLGEKAEVRLTQVAGGDAIARQDHGWKAYPLRYLG